MPYLPHIADEGGPPVAAQAGDPFSLATEACPREIRVVKTNASAQSAISSQCHMRHIDLKTTRERSLRCLQSRDSSWPPPSQQRSQLRIIGLIVLLAVLMLVALRSWHVGEAGLGRWTPKYALILAAIAVFAIAPFHAKTIYGWFSDPPAPERVGEVRDQANVLAALVVIAGLMYLGASTAKQGLATHGVDRRQPPPKCVPGWRRCNGLGGWSAWRQATGETDRYAQCEARGRASMKQYWLTAISVVIGVLLVVLPILGGLFGDEEDESGAVLILQGFIVVVGFLLLAGVWWLRTGRFSQTVCLSLIGVGLAVFGAFFFWLLFIPTALALIVIWFGIVKRGLVTELGPAAAT